MEGNTLCNNNIATLQQIVINAIMALPEDERKAFVLAMERSMPRD